MIDPLIPLASTMSLGRGVHAFFLGAGVSRAASVPTGPEIFQETLKQLYRCDNRTEEVPPDEELRKWFNESHYNGLTYSSILREMYPGRDDRRMYLEQFFKDKRPTDYHKGIAQLVNESVVRLIVTTNFDNLMEQALDDIGQTYDVVTEASDLSSVCPREHSSCRVLKLHGDWRHLNMRNTEAELERLEPELEREFIEILDRYSLVVLGYSGSDKGVMRCMKQRRSIYPLFWMLREGSILSPELETFFDDQKAYLIQRRDADSMLQELRQMMHVLSSQPRRESPELLAVKVEDLLRQDDTVGLGRLIQEEVSFLFQEGRRKLTQFRPIADIEGVKEAFDEMQNLSDRMTSIGLALVQHQADELFTRLTRSVQTIVDIYLGENEPRWLRPSSFSILHDVLYLWGALGVYERNFNALRSLLLASAPKADGTSCPLWENHEVVRSNFLWRFYGREYPAQAYWGYFLERYCQQPFVLRYFAHEGDLRSAVAQFSFLLSIFSIIRLQIPQELNGMGGSYGYPEVISPEILQQLIPFHSGLHDQSVQAIVDLIVNLHNDEVFLNNIASLSSESPEHFKRNMPVWIDYICNLMAVLEDERSAEVLEQVLFQIRSMGLS